MIKKRKALFSFDDISSIVSSKGAKLLTTRDEFKKVVHPASSMYLIETYDSVIESRHIRSVINCKGMLYSKRYTIYHSRDYARYTRDEIDKLCKEKNIEYINGDYINNLSKLTFKCLSCGSEFKRSLDSIANNDKKQITCNECYYKSVADRKFLDESVVKNNLRAWGYELISDYTYATEPIYIKCRCGNEFKTVYNTLQYKHDGKNVPPSCSKCKLKHKSNAERDLIKFIKRITLDEVKENYRKLISPFEVDALIESKKLAIEFDGIYWHCDKIKDRNYHLTKTEKVNKKGYALMHIFESEWFNIRSRKIIKGIIEHKLGSNEFVDGTAIDVPLDSECEKFLIENNLFGYQRGIINLCLRTKGRMIVSLLSVNKVDDDKFEIIRFCNKRGFEVKNSFLLLLNYFKRLSSPKIITCQCDRRLFSGNTYIENGFVVVDTEPPEYYYFKDRLNFRYQSQNKEKISIDELKTSGWRIIWDCGKINYEWRKERNECV